MDTDLSQFYQVFFDETAEHLAAMESLLLALDAEHASDDDLNAIFRAAHSIKGSSGTFGFTDLTEVTHELETLLDRLRKREMAITPEMIDVFLQARDVLLRQLDAHRGSGESPVEDAAGIKLILKNLASGAVQPQRPGTAVAPAPNTTAVIDVHVQFEAAPDAQAIYECLSTLGSAEAVPRPEQAAGDPPPPWHVRLCADCSDDKIFECLSFIASADVICITRSGEQAEAKAPSPYGFFTEEPPAPKSAAAYGFFEEVSAPEAQVPSSAYGFFADVLPAPEQAAPVHGRRAVDDPGVPLSQGGRRAADKAKPAAAAVDNSSIRVSVQKVDSLINLVGELVITQAMLAQTAAQADPVLFERLHNSIALLDRNTRDLQESVMSIRMMPMSFVFSRFPRVVRDVATKLGKDVELKTEGESTELDKGLIEKLSDPLTHLVRNSLDHGIETPDKRVAAGKPARGTLTLRACHQGGNILIEVRDDGGGISREKILAKARERGMDVSDALSDQEVFALIFEAGFSTAEVVTDVSGRGVGMDVVRRNIREMGGAVEINSTLGRGTAISIRLPLTLAILDGLSIAVGEETFIVPLTHIVESLQPGEADVKAVGGSGLVLHVRGEYLPLLKLHEEFNIKPRAHRLTDGIVVILEADGRKSAIFVDALLGQHQVVIKNLETNYRRVRGVSGATIMGDGKVALILDTAAVVQFSPPIRPVRPVLAQAA